MSPSLPGIEQPMGDDGFLANCPFKPFWRSREFILPYVSRAFSCLRRNGPFVIAVQVWTPSWCTRSTRESAASLLTPTTTARRSCPSQGRCSPWGWTFMQVRLPRNGVTGFHRHTDIVWCRAWDSRYAADPPKFEEVFFFSLLFFFKILGYAWKFAALSSLGLGKAFAAVQLHALKPLLPSGLHIKCIILSKLDASLLNVCCCKYKPAIVLKSFCYIC